MYGPMELGITSILPSNVVASEPLLNDSVGRRSHQGAPQDTRRPPADFERVAAHLELVPMRNRRRPLRTRGQVGARVLPNDDIISLFHVMGNGASAEIAIVGCEGILGISLFMDGGTTPSGAVVQSAGHGFRLKSIC
jgi:hypothetical protein